MKYIITRPVAETYLISVIQILSCSCRLGQDWMPVTPGKVAYVID